MKFQILYQSLVLIISLFFCVSIVSCSGDDGSSFDYDQYNYSIDSLQLGISYPNSSTIEGLQSSIESMNNLDSKWVRLGEHWNLREVANNSYNWIPLGTRLTAYNDAGIKVLLTLETHEWPSWLGLVSSSTKDEAATLSEFRQYVADLLLLYATQIERIQLGNEYDWEIDTYFNSKEEAYITYCNILYEEVQKIPEANRPDVVLGSISGAGSTSLALDQNRITSVTIGGIDVYSSIISSYLALPAGDRMTERVENILTNTNFDYLDIHFYDDYEHWNIYLDAYKQALTDSGKPTVGIIVSEFGGPYPVSLYSVFGGEPREDLLAGRLVSYIQTLDTLDILETYFFKLNQTNSGQAHPDSYLVKSNGQKSISFEVFRRFGANATH